jgi:hypothetical protein
VDVSRLSHGLVGSRLGATLRDVPLGGGFAPALGLGPIDALIDVFGPFVIPVLFFVAGIVGYLVLVALGRAGIVGRRD